MLVLDKSLPYIEVDAQDIIALYRSSSAVSLTSGNFGPGQWLAYLCGVQEQNAYGVFMALLNPNTRKVHVYSLDDHPENRDEYAKVLQESVKFAEKMGFSMQNINLDYSRALREVIISDTKVIKPAKHGKKSVVRKGGESREKIDETGKSESKPSQSPNLHLVKNEKNDVEQEIAADKNPPVGVMHDSGRAPAKAPDAVSPPVEGKGSASDAELRRLSAEKSEREKESARQLAEAGVEVDRLRSVLAELDKKTRVELQRLKKEAERVAEDKASAEKTASDEIAAARAGVENLEGELSLLRKNAGTEISALKAEAKKLSREKEASERAASEELAAARADMEKLQAEIDEIRAGSSEKIGGYRADRERLASEKLAVKSTLDEDLAAAEADRKALAAELSSAEKSALEKLQAVRSEMEKLKAEKSEAEARSSSALADAQGEIGRLTEEMKAIESTSARTLASLSEEVKRLESAKFSAEKEGVEKVEAAKAALAALDAEKAAVAATLEEQLSAICKEEESMAAAKRAAEKEAEKTLAEARDRVDRLSAETVALEAAAAQKLVALLDEENRLKAENAEAEKEAALKLEAVKDELEKIAAEKVAAEELHMERLSAVLEETLKLAAEKDSAENAFSGEIAGAISGLERVISETIYSVNSIVGKLVDFKSRAEGLISGLETERAFPLSPEIPLEKVTVVEKQVRTEVSHAEASAKAENIAKPHVAEKKEAAPEAVKVTSFAKKQENELTSKEKDKESESRHQEMKFGEESLSVEKALADLSAPVSHGSDGVGSIPEAKEKESGSWESAAVEDDVFRSLEAEEEVHEEEPENDEDGADSATGFHIDKSMGRIECGPKDDVIDVYQSLNIARITPEGYLAQNSRAYVCAVRKRGSVSVFIGLQLTDNDKVLVYVPEKQPKSRNFRKTFQDAVDFLETAGFLMDRMSLGNDPKTHAKIIGKIPVLGGAN